MLIHNLIQEQGGKIVDDCVRTACKAKIVGEDVRRKPPEKLISRLGKYWRQQADNGLE